MRIHTVLDAELVRAAEEAYPEAHTKKALLEAGLRTLIERAAARELARLVRGRSFQLAPVPRPRPSPCLRAGP